MRNIIGWMTAATLLLTCVFTASAQAAPTSFTSSNVTSPGDGSLLFQNWDADPNATITVAGTTNWTAGDASNLFDIACYNGSAPPYPTDVYQGPGNLGLGLDPGGNFAIAMPQDYFGGQSCHLLVVPHGTTPDPGTSFTGPRVGFSYLTYDPGAGGSRETVNINFNDATTQADDGGNSSEYCGASIGLVDGTSAMNIAPVVFSCPGDFLTSSSDTRWQGASLPGLGMDANVDLTRSEIQVDGHNAYGSTGAEFLFTGSDVLANFPALSFNVDSFSTANGDAQTTESEQLVKCTPQDVFAPTHTNCTAFVPTGVAFKRVSEYTNGGRVITVTDTFTSTDGLAHALDLQYETELGGGAAGWQFPGQSGYSYPAGTSGPAATAAPETMYAIDNPTSSPSLTNPVGAATISVPYNSVKFDDTIWGPSHPSTLFDFQRMVPASGSASITWSYATGTSLAEVQVYAAAARAAMQPPTVAIFSPASGATVTGTPVRVTGNASAPSGVSSVTVNGVTATLSNGNWMASVPVTRGRNTLTATATSDDGGTRSATATVTYAPRPQISLISKRFNGKVVLVKLACRVGDPNCGGNLTLRYIATVVKHHKRHRVTVLIASKHYAISYGQIATVTATLNSTGRKLLKKLGKLAATGTVTVIEPSGRRNPAATFKLTIK